ncbi:hypothetical protein KC346_g20452 [Hortaea werneckii]|nr:hypothetical protein KC346_g20452 [Hortaea werneckii]
MKLLAISHAPMLMQYWQRHFFCFGKRRTGAAGLLCEPESNQFFPRCNPGNTNPCSPNTLQKKISLLHPFAHPEDGRRLVRTNEPPFSKTYSIRYRDYNLL